VSDLPPPKDCKFVNVIANLLTILVAVFLGLITLLTVIGGGGGGGGPNPSDPQPSSTSASCVPTVLPTPVVVVTHEDTSVKHFDNLLNDILSEEQATILDDINLDDYNHRAFLATITQCTFKQLIENPLVSTISYNAPIYWVEDTVTAPAQPELGSRSSNVADNSSSVDELSNALEERAIPTAQENLITTVGLGSSLHAYAAQSPYHLNWLTAPWAQQGLTGLGPCKLTLSTASDLTLWF
jgi:hypothetical protein